ncbi:MAG: hypothetical protein KatS3mg070_1437 [Meiothermus sp.]|nr:MAG: hypothetical protein KatS3mg070_1437 [Meiothermus sp.]
MENNKKLAYSRKEVAELLVVSRFMCSSLCRGEVPLLQHLF